ncbi:hypothetical protein DBR11_17300 [Pedobacter sp. HMWF019]|uniref:hypothetical protein n=1 Tax=Pedobacter sp. HMWF019 TaxID=2056856 RepID=UPI000D393CC6|nr:hypothetical protein [Pedobacter sp. HMWF019]PTS97362.1 hypothetical protein DBR11_17300 [Pedobacter sp. HMWF019]
MKKAIYLMASIALLVTACTENKKPADLLNQQASLPAGLNFSKMGFKVINSSINVKSNTMSTLYGNNTAQTNARSSTKLRPAGEIFALVTWKKQPDKHWFGANIPGDLQSLEMVKTTTSGTIYQLYKGQNLTLSTDTSLQQQRTRYILEQTPSIMP